jgi:hypothetical protein
MTLYTNEECSGIASVYNRALEHADVRMDKQETIEIKILDSFCESEGIEHINFLKMDIEGHELKALEGAKNLLENDKIDYIQFEFGGCNIDSRTYFKDFYYLLKDKYILYRIIRDGFYELKEYKELYECFTAVNFFAKHRAIDD